VTQVANVPVVTATKYSVSPANRARCVPWPEIIPLNRMCVSSMGMTSVRTKS